MRCPSVNLIGVEREFVFEKRKLEILLKTERRDTMGQFKYFRIGHDRPLSNIKNFHLFCIAYSYYYMGYRSTYGYRCPTCFGNGHEGCKVCQGSGKTQDRSSIIRKYIEYRREYRAAVKYWENLKSVWEDTVDRISLKEQEALEVFGRR